MIVLVTDEDDRCLLARNVLSPPGRFSTVAGFVEPGESPEQAVVREVAEETGIVVTSSRYAGSQPWPFPSNLMLGFYARADGAEPRPDGEEIDEARWFSRDELTAALESGERAPFALRVDLASPGRGVVRLRAAPPPLSAMPGSSTVI